jgi:hypothetical protein
VRGKGGGRERGRERGREGRGKGEGIEFSSGHSSKSSGILSSRNTV